MPGKGFDSMGPEKTTPAAGWEQLEESVAIARAKILAAAPDGETAAEGEAYLTRVVSGILADGFLAHFSFRHGLYSPLPTKGAPNPDYRLAHAPVSADGSLELIGELNGSERVGVGLYAIDAAGATLERGYRVFDGSSVDSDGKFSLEISADPGSPRGLKIEPDCRVVLIRTLHRDRDRPPAELKLLGTSANRDLPVPGGSNEAGLTLAGQMTLKGVEQFLVWSEICGQRPNQLFDPPDSIAATVQGDPDTRYLLGYYLLGDGEWLEVELPPGLQGYWSLHAYNHWGEILPGAGRHDLDTEPDSAGRLLISIGPNLPETVVNGVDTLGRKRGMLVFRAIAGTETGALGSGNLPETRIKTTP